MYLKLNTSKNPSKYHTMSVFSKHHKKSIIEQIEEVAVELRNEEKNDKNDEKILCKKSHTWKNQTPFINPNILQVQNEHLMGVPCDCGRFIYHEEACGCAVKHWEIKLIET